jgi:hypothetical protein
MKPVVYPADYLFRPEPPALSSFGRRLLAEGDSWFTIGTLNLPQSSNVLFKLEFEQSHVIVNCAYPGDTLQHMVDHVNDPYFDRLLRRPRFASYWEAVLVSAGGNDLIDAAQVPPVDRKGRPIPADRRLILTPEEAATKAAATGCTGAASHISDAGWERLAAYLRANMAELVARRDQGPSAGRPIFLHTYAVPTVRPAGTVGAPQGWLHPACVAASVPDALRQEVADLLFERLRQLLLGLAEGSGQAHALSHVHVFDSAALPTIQPAAPGSTGKSGDWINEIHLSPAGYAKMGHPFGAFIDGVLAAYP